MKLFLTTVLTVFYYDIRRQTTPKFDSGHLTGITVKHTRTIPIGNLYPETAVRKFL